MARKRPCSHIESEESGDRIRVWIILFLATRKLLLLFFLHSQTPWGLLHFPVPQPSPSSPVVRCLISFGLCARYSHSMTGSEVAGSVVALGKFEGLHVGHRALAERAAEMGTPFLLSFSGMAEVLGWEPQLPVVAKYDRGRVMKLWAEHCKGMVPQEHVLEFARIRSWTPEQFVEKLATELKVKGVVAGVDYRFGFRAAGKASDLVQLCEKYGLQSSIVDPVMDAKNAGLPTEIKGKEKGQVSTTGIRKALAEGDMKHAQELLGRPHRLFISTDGFTRSESTIHLPVANVLNQPPKSGSYNCRIVHEDSEVSTDSEPLVGKLHIQETEISLELPDLKLVDTLTQQSRIVLDVVM